MNLLTSEPLGAGSGTWRINQMRLEEQPRILHQADGSAESLDRSAYEVLRYLLVNAGEVCTHDELLTAGWPGRIVTNNSLAKCVSRLRTALQGEDAQVLQVVHRFGYRLVGDVRFVPSALAGVSLVSATGAVEAPERIPFREAWRTVRLLGRGATGDVWLAENSAGEQRAYKLTHSETGLRSLKREVARMTPS